MPHARQHLAPRGTVAPQPVGDDASRLVFQAGEQALEEPLRSRGIPAILHEDVEHHTMLVHRAPEIMQYAIDPQVHLVKVPGYSRPN